MTVTEVGNLLRAAAPGDGEDREVHLTAIRNSHRAVGTVFFSLDGSPPKAYAIFVFEFKQLSVYGVRGGGKRTLQEVSIERAEWDGVTGPMTAWLGDR